jgi:hypothetical protein
MLDDRIQRAAVDEVFGDSIPELSIAQMLAFSSQTMHERLPLITPTLPPLPRKNLPERHGMEDLKPPES